jgi:hypothetical protein
VYYLDLFAGIGGFALGALYAGRRFDKHYYVVLQVTEYLWRLVKAALEGNDL